MALLAGQVSLESRAHFERENSELLEAAREPRVGVRGMRDIEQVLEIMRVPEAGFDWEPIDRILLAEFGCIRLGRDPMDAVKKVLESGRIRGQRQGEVIRAFVACVDNERVLGSEAYGKLALILDTWESKG
jgi:hypothetical protein